MQETNFKEEFAQQNRLLAEIVRYVSFWPWFLVSLTIGLTACFIYLRYSEYNYNTTAKIEILDKAQDSEMALPTSMTIFNRSMINLENEIGVLKSYKLHKRVVESLNSNVKFFSEGLIKTAENGYSNWSKNLEVDFLIDTDSISFNRDYIISGKETDNFKVSVFEKDNLVEEYVFSKTSSDKKHNLPFNIKIKSDLNFDKKITLSPVDDMVKYYKSLVVISRESSGESDQLTISMNYSNSQIAEEYINKLIFEFDRDGIVDRQMEYSRTIDFVDSRSTILKSELEQIENKKLNFKRDNNLSDLSSDASNIINQKLTYNSELFNAESQRDLASLLLQSIDEQNYVYLPINIGFESSTVNTMITEYNLAVKERDMYLISAGVNNKAVKNIENLLDKILQNIISSIKNYQNNLDIEIKNIIDKENEFAEFYSDIPQNEKILRSIERELNVKESLFLLLLQKREEAAINFAVVKPSIKIIDGAMSSARPVSPNSKTSYAFSFIMSMLVPLIILYLWFFFDTKIHTKDQLLSLIDVPVIGEVPYINKQKELTTLSDSTSRTPLAESIRMTLANLSFQLGFSNNKNCKVILVTSSIKGEGKTIISGNISSILSSNSNKVLLIGSDLRNPQLHKLLGREKDIKGLSDMVYKNDINNYKKYLIKRNNLDIILSGTIPPNPGELLSSKIFDDFIKLAKQNYDYIIVDSAPCLLVSDTFEISKHTDLTLYVVRANFSETMLSNFISECISLEKLPNICLVLNSVGNSRSYGYKYGYQYGYQYGYNYSYNYGYGYGYGQSPDESS